MAKKSNGRKAKQRRNKKRQILYKQSQDKKRAVKKTRKVLRRTRLKEERVNTLVFADIVDKLASVAL